jgi:hypothetical protein
MLSRGLAKTSTLSSAGIKVDPQILQFRPGLSFRQNFGADAYR